MQSWLYFSVFLFVLERYKQLNIYLYVVWFGLPLLFSAPKYKMRKAEKWEKEWWKITWHKEELDFRKYWQNFTRFPQPLSSQNDQRKVEVYETLRGLIVACECLKLPSTQVDGSTDLTENVVGLRVYSLISWQLFLYIPCAYARDS